MGRRTFKLHADKILRELDRRRWTLQTLAAKALVDPATLTRVLNKGEKASIDTLVKIGNALGIKDRTVLVDDPLAPNKPAKSPDIVYYIVGFRKEGDYADASELNDGLPFAEWLRSQPNVAYAAFVNFVPLSSFLIQIELSARAIRFAVLHLLANRAFEPFDITALYLPVDCQAGILETVREVDFTEWRTLYPNKSDFEIWLDISFPADSFTVTMSEDGTAILKPAARVNAEVLV